MPSYVQLQAEPVWRAQVVPENLTSLLIQPLRDHYSLGPASVGAPGDNNHLYGRHRSANWDRTSIYSTDRQYGTVDARDRIPATQNWYRAVDTGITGEVLQAASHRMDGLARSGGCPGLAEWFGTFDGQTVVGWFEGGPSTSDDSHLSHLHVGLWTQYANDPATLSLIYATITGTQGVDMQQYFFGHDNKDNTYWLCDGIFARGPLQRPPVHDEIADIKQLAAEGMFTLWKGGEIREGMVSAFGLRVPWAGTGGGGGGLEPHTHSVSDTGPAEPTA